MSNFNLSARARVRFGDDVKINEILSWQSLEEQMVLPWCGFVSSGL